MTDKPPNIDSKDCRICQENPGACSSIHSDQIVTNKVDLERRTHCQRGHEFTPENTVYPSSGGRGCKKCQQQATRRWRDEFEYGGNREKVIQRDGEACVKCGMTRQEHRARFGKDITVDHIDGKGRGSEKKNNDPSNLQTLCSPCHTLKDGQRRVYPRKLSDEQVAEIKLLYETNPGTVLAKKYGVSRSTIYYIATGRKQERRIANSERVRRARLAKLRGEK